MDGHGSNLIYYRYICENLEHLFIFGIHSYPIVSAVKHLQACWLPWLPGCIHPSSMVAYQLRGHGEPASYHMPHGREHTHNTRTVGDVEMPVCLLHIFRRNFKYLKESYAHMGRTLKVYARGAKLGVGLKKVLKKLCESVG